MYRFICRPFFYPTRPRLGKCCPRNGAAYVVSLIRGNSGHCSPAAGYPLCASPQGIFTHSSGSSSDGVNTPVSHEYQVRWTVTTLQTSHNCSVSLSHQHSLLWTDTTFKIWERKKKGSKFRGQKTASIRFGCDSRNQNEIRDKNKNSLGSLYTLFTS